MKKQQSVTNREETHLQVSRVQAAQLTVQGRHIPCWCLKHWLLGCPRPFGIMKPEEHCFMCCIIEAAALGPEFSMSRSVERSRSDTQSGQEKQRAHKRINCGPFHDIYGPFGSVQASVVFSLVSRRACNGGVQFSVESLLCESVWVELRAGVCH